MNDDVLSAYGSKKLEEYTHWVYVLECKERWFCKTYDELAQRCEKRIGREPGWLRMAWESNSVRYVGQTEDLEKRLGQHLQDKMSSDFTTVFEPYDVETLKPVRSRNRAEYLEEQIGKSYYGNDDIYAYWN